jgi:hypothetical protein
MSGERVPRFAMLRLLDTRSFWNARTINAFLGAGLTVTAGVTSLLVNDRLRNEARELDREVAMLDARLARIDRFAFEQQLFETTGILIRGLGAGGAIPEPLRENFLYFRFDDRRYAFRSILGEISPTAEAFKRALEDYDALAARARAGQREATLKLTEVESMGVIRMRELQQTLISERFEKARERRQREDRLEQVTIIGFVLQQIGFVIVLTAGLLADQAARVGRPDEAKPIGGGLT